MPTRKHWYLIVGVLILLAVVASVAWYLGHSNGEAAGAAAALAAGAGYWASRGRTDSDLDSASDGAAEAVEEIEEIGADAARVSKDNEVLVSSMSGEDKARLIDELTDEDTDPG